MLASTTANAVFSAAGAAEAVLPAPDLVPASFSFPRRIEPEGKSKVEEPAAKSIINREAAAQENRKKFRFVPYSKGEKERFSKDESLDISDTNINCAVTGRHPGFPIRLRDLAIWAERELPPNMQIEYAVSDGAGSAAYDEVAIKIYGDDGEVVGQDRFSRSIERDDAVFTSALFLPKSVRDFLFIMKIKMTAFAMDFDYRMDPQNSEVFCERPNGGYQGLW